MSQTGNPSQPEFGKVPNSDGAKFEEIQNQRVFLSGIHPNDVDQGLLGDCYFLSSIASIAMQNANIIKEMIANNADGTYTVKLFKRGWFGSLTPTEITVDGHFPMKNNKPAFAGLGDQFTTPDGKAQKEIWPMILEKAYAQMHGGYNQIIGGWPHHAMESLTGVPSLSLRPKTVSFNQVATYFDEGFALSAYTRNEIKFNLFGNAIDLPDRTNHPQFKKNGGKLSAGHAYWISGVSKEEKLIKIRNPWGWEHGELGLTEDEFQATMRGFSANSITARSK